MQPNEESVHPVAKVLAAVLVSAVAATAAWAAGGDGRTVLKQESITAQVYTDPVPGQRPDKAPKSSSKPAKAPKSSSSRGG